MLETRETLRHDFTDQFVVINAKDVQGALLFELWQGAPAGSMVDLNAAVVALRHVRYGRCVHVKSVFVDS
jgi:hypothetical protein